MQGQNWTDLMTAVKVTIEYILNTPSLKNSIKITVINYNQNARIIFEKEEPSLDLLNFIDFGGGGTNFGNSLSLAYKTIINSKNEFDIFTVGFLTDGHAQYPSNIIKRINDDNEMIKDRINFNCVLLGNGNSNLKTIATNLNANYKNVIDLEALKQSFIEIIGVMGIK